MTGSLRLTSASVDSVSEMTSTVPRLVPTHRHGHVDGSVTNPHQALYYTSLATYGTYTPTNRKYNGKEGRRH